MLTNLLLADSHKLRYGNVGIPGQKGFGLGVCLEDVASLDSYNMSPMQGYNDPNNINYGNYLHEPTGSVMCWIPAFKYRVNDRFLNSVDIWRPDDPSCPQNAVLHRAFIDGGHRKSGFFCDKYLCSPSSNNIAVSVKNGSILSLYSKSDYGKYTGSMPNCLGRLDDAITASRARGKGFQCMSVFQLGALRLLVLAHAQASKSTEFNAWYDSSGQHNLPRGNTDNLKDHYNHSITWRSDPYYTNKGLTGSCTPFAASTHNGQECGIADLKGCLHQVVTGCIGNYFLSTKTRIADLDRDEMYNINHHEMYNVMTGYQGWDPNKPMFNNDNIGVHWACAGFLNTCTNVGDQMFTGMFEEDQQVFVEGNTRFPSTGVNWFMDYLQYFGLFYTATNDERTTDSYNHGFRACCYLT